MVTATTGSTAADPYAALNALGGNTKQTDNEAGSADRFLKLLVTQMQNQDPLNPTDNAQITSQMAQINTVSGIDKLNATVSGLNGQFGQLQALQGTALIGRDVTLKGNRLDIDEGKGTGAFDLPSTADNVKVEVLSPAGRVVDTLQLGAQPAGRHAFDWDASKASAGDYSFRVTAAKGSAAITTTALMRDRVQAVSSDASGLVLQTAHTGNVAYIDVKAFN